ncbi:cobalt-precorrin-5B (C(1))-methyltransferase CbiD [Pleurocapsa sp. PCC 7319]|uniref:cobalt-precorrin-5B (C(1))-methyltransferase CbiD n=1 Tax=Pleurocapsa sp. PCC 7319 TaxID=118161 RepID=UPI0003759FD9|nr:cobalt-precorrin-5B (C(1))-methyltransferase CbiD [Pleurocapsa sp. PCC 7319]
MSQNNLSLNAGYTLPIFACASAIAALRHLHQDLTQNTVTVNLINPNQQADITVEQVAKIDEFSAIAITRSDPGDHLDLTRNTPVWAKVSLTNSRSSNQISIEGGEGIGRQVKEENQAAIYSYAQEVIRENLQPLLYPHESIVVTIILPEGIRLAKRTSNEAFGVVEGLSLLGTTGIVQPLIAPSQLEAYQAQIKAKAKLFDTLVFCIGENGIDLAQKSGIDPSRIVKTANWLGSMLVTAGLAQVKSILLFGYHGKLIKLAGGIFHTHNHLADGRLEILTAYCAKLGFPRTEVEKIFNCSTTESALNLLRELDINNKGNLSWVELVYGQIAEAIDLKSQEYISKYTEEKICVGSVLFDRSRRIIKKSSNATLLLSELC